ncbi:putative chromatin remodeling & transcription regulator BTB-POZ family [Helianthus debilis subsp. tardiflorus]
MKAVGDTYHLHRLILSHNSYFRLLISYFPSMTKIIGIIVLKSRFVEVILWFLMAGMYAIE